MDLDDGPPNDTTQSALAHNNAMDIDEEDVEMDIDEEDVEMDVDEEDIEMEDGTGVVNERIDSAELEQPERVHHDANSMDVSPWMRH